MAESSKKTTTKERKFKLFIQDMGAPKGHSDYLGHHVFHSTGRKSAGKYCSETIKSGHYKNKFPDSKLGFQLVEVFANLDDAGNILEKMKLPGVTRRQRLL